MVIDVAFLTLNLVLFAGIGLPACLLLRSEARTLAAPAFGLGIFGVAATLLYKLGLPLDLVGFTGWLVSLPGLALLFFRAITEYRRAALAAVFVASVSIIIILPK